ncbi:MAG: apolipoprotein N-acyltransferase [Alphaproteobacteria bacterium]
MGYRDRILALTGWRRSLLAALCGVLAAAALPPWHLLPLLIPAFVGLVWLLDGARTLRAALFLGWSFGTGYFLLGLHWIAEPLLVDAARHAWLIPFALIGLSGGLAIFTALTCGLWAWLLRRGFIAGAGRIVALAALWTVLEWVRAWIFTGFPWNLLGYVWSPSTAMLQIASLTGIYGLSMITVLAAAMPALFGQRPGPHPRRRAALVMACTILLPVALFGYGSARLAAAPAPGATSVADVRLRIVQANIPQALKWQADRRLPNLQQHVAMSRQPAADGVAPTHVIWPETAVPFFLANDDGARRLAATAAPAGGLLITGAPRSEDTTGATPRRFWNSVHAIDSNAAIQATYDKSHLVPFGEYVPARGILPIDKIVPGQGDFTPGSGRRSLRLAGLPAVGVLVCYEAIFPGAAVDRADRPQWILNLTNDAWFGTGAGPRQHFAISRLRAIEEGLPLIRAANTGISGVIDPYGRILAQLPVGETGILDTDLPVALAGPTLFARLGNTTLIWLMALAALFTGLLNRRGALES